MMSGGATTRARDAEHHLCARPECRAQGRRVERAKGRALRPGGHENPRDAAEVRGVRGVDVHRPPVDVQHRAHGAHTVSGHSRAGAERRGRGHDIGAQGGRHRPLRGRHAHHHEHTRSVRRRYG